MTAFDPRPARPQAPLADEPYDRWILPDGYVKAEFRRMPEGFHLRFPGEADFAIDIAGAQVTGWPVPDTTQAHFISLFQNAILPLIGDHAGGLFLHGSAVLVGGQAVAFLGQSGDGKTTLAGAFAKAGYPFLTEDVIELVAEAGRYWLQPKPSGLRLYADSAAHLLGDTAITPDANGKVDVADAALLPFADQPAPLAALVLLGPDHGAPLMLARLPEHKAAHQLLPHSFVLDVEDKGRLRGHFSRIMGLCCDTPCYALDYLRDYADLPRVIAAIVAEIGAGYDR